MKTKITGVQISSWICALLILAMIVLLFTPYWQYTTKEKNPDTGKREEVTKTISISDYVWFPRDHKDLAKDYEKTTDLEMSVNDEVTMPIVLLLLGAIGCIYGAINAKTFVAPLATLLLGAYSGMCYASSAFLKMGIGNGCQTRMIVSFAAAAVGLAGLAVYIISAVAKKKVAAK